MKGQHIFSEQLEDWYTRNGRTDLPWRGITDPYRIWISEIILQQTRVEQGRDYYLRFIERFPDVFTLAAAEEDEVLKLWQGLGYYSRARNLHAAAKSIAEAGAFPTTYEGIRALKGVGDYTAAAIGSFAYRLPYPVVDGNVYRVLSRIWGIGTPIDSTEGKKQFAALAAELLDRDQPDLYNSAIMDFGALQCTPKSPDCLFCPFAGDCAALVCGRVEDFPVKAKKTAVKDRFLVYLYLEDADHLLLHRRPEGDIWQGLYEPYLLEFDHAPSEKEVLEKAQANGLPLSTGLLQPVARGLKHLLSHRRLMVDCYRAVLPQLPELGEYMNVPKTARNAYAVPRIVDTLYELIG